MINIKSLIEVENILLIILILYMYIDIDYLSEKVLNLFVGNYVFYNIFQYFIYLFPLAFINVIFVKFKHI